MTRHVLITGTSSGIGLSLAGRFLREGWLVTGVDRSPGAIEAEGYDHRRADITAEAEIDAAFQAANSRALLSAVISNAAVTDLDHRMVAELDYPVWQRVLRVNVDGAFLTARAAARTLRRGGNIVFVTSSLAFLDQAKANDAPYCSSKAAVEMLMRVLALELAPAGINVTTLFPSVKVATGFFSHLSPDEQAELAGAGILDETALFLATRPAGALTGISLDQQRWDDDPAYRGGLEAAR